MPHYKSMLSQKYAGAWSLKGDTTLTIERVVAETLKNRSGEDRKPVVYFKGAKLGMPMNRTNCATISAMYGPDTDDWIGKRITMFATMVNFGRDQVEAVRVKAGIPGAKAKDGELSDEDAPPDMRARQQAAADRAAGVEPEHDDDGVVADDLTPELVASTRDAYLKQLSSAETVPDLRRIVAAVFTSRLPDGAKEALKAAATVRRAQLESAAA